MAFNRNKNQRPIGRRYVPEGQTGPRPAFRKGSNDGVRTFEPKRGAFRRGRGGNPKNFDRVNKDVDSKHPGGRKMIKKSGGKPIIKEKDDLDRQMRQYWIKSGAAKGKEEVEKQKNIAS